MPEGTSREGYSVPPWELKNKRSALLLFNGNARRGRAKSLISFDNYSQSHTSDIIKDPLTRSENTQLFLSSDYNFRTHSEAELAHDFHVLPARGFKGDNEFVKSTFPT